MWQYIVIMLTGWYALYGGGGGGGGGADAAGRAASAPPGARAAGPRLTVRCGRAVDLSRTSTELSDLHLDSATGGAGRDSRFTLLHVN